MPGAGLRQQAQLGPKKKDIKTGETGGRVLYFLYFLYFLYPSLSLPLSLSCVVHHHESASELLLPTEVHLNWCTDSQGTRVTDSAKDIAALVE